MFSKIVPIAPFPLRKLLPARLYRWCKKTGQRLSRVQIEVLQGHAASVLGAEERFFSAKTTLKIYVEKEKKTNYMSLDALLLL
jgi:hypothetical protein